METAANDAQIFPQNFQKSRKLLNLRNANNSIGNDGNSGTNNGKKTSAKKKKFENWCIPREVVLFYGNFGKNCSIRYWKLPKIQTRCLDWMEGTQLISGQITYLNCECTARMETDCNFIQNGPRFSRISSCVVKKCPRTDDALFPFDRITWCLSCRVPKRRLKSLLRACSIDRVPEKE